MFRKIRSNRDPQDTLFSEVRKEFRPYFDQLGNKLTRLTRLYPHSLFALMVFAIVASLICTFIVFRRPAEPPKKMTAGAVNPVSAGFSQIIAAGAALQKTIQLKKQVDSLVHLKSLSRADSLELSRYLDTLNLIRQTLK